MDRLRQLDLTTVGPTRWIKRRRSRICPSWASGIDMGSTKADAIHFQQTTFEINESSEITIHASQPECGPISGRVCLQKLDRPDAAHCCLRSIRRLGRHPGRSRARSVPFPNPIAAALVTDRLESTQRPPLQAWIPVSGSPGGRQSPRRRRSNLRDSAETHPSTTLRPPESPRLSSLARQAAVWPTAAAFRRQAASTIG